jgi:phosphomannomutase/phosphoglucomutase
MDFGSISHVFREYDIRGIYDSELTPEFAFHLGKTFGIFMKKRGNVCVGRDVRRGAQSLEDSFVDGLQSTGCNVTTIGQVPIGIANFAIWKGTFKAGVYLTASHNPPEYNGFRLRHSDGTGFIEENNRIKDIFFDNRQFANTLTKAGKLFQKKTEEIIKSYWSLISTTHQNLGRLKIGVDAGNGGASGIAGDILEKAGYQTIRINDSPDENYPNRSPHNKDSEIGKLKSLVVQEGCDLGVAFDGDADRCVFVDDQGRSCKTEKILITLARQIQTEREKKVVVSVPCSTILENELEPLGIRVIRSKVGDVHVSEAMKRNNAILGGEVSSHIFVPDFYFFDDSFLATLKLAEALLKSGSRLSSLMDGIQDYPYEQIFVPCPDDIKFEIVDLIAEQFSHANAEISRLDGIRILDSTGWVLVRGSNTEPLIKVIVEGKDIESFRTKKEDILSALETKMESFGLSLKLVEAKNA